MKEKINFERIVLFYTICVVLATLLAKRIWKVGVHLVGIIVQRRAARRGGSLPGEAAREEKKRREERTNDYRRRCGDQPWHAGCCLLFNFIHLYVFTSCSATKEVASEKGSSATIQGPKSEERSYGGPLAKRNSHAKGSTSKSLIINSIAPNIEEDTFGSWDEIAREERLVRIELNAAKPGDPILGPIEQLPDEEFPELPFRVFTTRYGEVYHLDRNCRHLTSINTGISKEPRWCSRCWRSSYQAGSTPVRGAVLYLKGFGRDAHTDMRCPIGANHYQICTACQEQPAESSLS